MLVSFILIVCFRLVTLITRRRLWISITTVWIVLIVYGLVTVFGSGLVLVDGVQWCEIALVGLSAQLSSLVTSVLFVDLPIAGLILFYGVICVKLRRSVKTHKQLQVRILQISKPKFCSFLVSINFKGFFQLCPPPRFRSLSSCSILPQGFTEKILQLVP